MALTQTPPDNPFEQHIFKQTAVGTTADTFLGGQYPITLKSLNLKESSGSGVCSLKLYDSAGDGLSVGSSTPVCILKTPASGNLTYEFVEGGEFLNGLSWGGAKEDGTAATTAPDASTQVLARAE